MADKKKTDEVEKEVVEVEKVAKKVKTPEEYLEEKVPVMLYKDGEKYKDDVVLAINGEKIQIQRGVTVYIKRKYMSLLENQYRQQMVAANLQDQLAEEFANSTKARGLN